MNPASGALRLCVEIPQFAIRNSLTKQKNTETSEFCEPGLQHQQHPAESEVSFGEFDSLPQELGLLPIIGGTEMKTNAQQMKIDETDETVSPNVH